MVVNPVALLIADVASILASAFKLAVVFVLIDVA